MSKKRPAAWIALAIVAFAVVVTANSAGYRYGVSDQAYYVPAILAKLTPGLFPRDVAMLEAQGRFSVFDDVLALVVRATGLSLPALFAIGYACTVVLFAGATLLIGRAVYHSAWSGAALLAALALRHQVLGTGVNSFEGYFHPRVLAFAVGMLAVAALLRGRRGSAAAAAVASIVIHPTTGAWFALWVAVSLLVNAGGRRLFWTASVVLALGVVATAAGGSALGGSFIVMDDAWLDAIRSKRYLFPTSWAAGTWAVNALGTLAVVGVYGWRRRTGRVMPGERGVVWGCLALVAVFLASLPFIAAHLAIAVQLQTSRVFWHVELLATVYLVWALVDVPLERGAPWALAGRTLVIVLAAAGIARGCYILRVQFDRPLARVGLVQDDWEQMAAWARTATRPSASFLVDPQHVGRYGVSFRIAAARDVYLEAVKDSAMATYSRVTALDVVERQKAVPAFDALDADAARRLASRYGLDVMITERTMALPELRRVGRFHAYDLRSPGTTH